jgi:flagellar biosynthesis chaperone FliJ
MKSVDERAVEFKKMFEEEAGEPFTPANYVKHYMKNHVEALKKGGLHFLNPDKQIAELERDIEENQARLNELRFQRERDRFIVSSIEKFVETLEETN